MPAEGAPDAKLMTVLAPLVVMPPKTFRGASDGLPNDARSIVRPLALPRPSDERVTCELRLPATVTPSVAPAATLMEPPPVWAVVKPRPPADTVVGPL